ncbi:hypothetical protein ABK040_000853 [Willaertia magna]
MTHSNRRNSKVHFDQDVMNDMLQQSSTEEQEQEDNNNNTNNATTTTTTTNITVVAEETQTSTSPSPTTTNSNNSPSPTTFSTTEEEDNNNNNKDNNNNDNKTLPTIHLIDDQAIDTTLNTNNIPENHQHYDNNNTINQVDHSTQTTINYTTTNNNEEEEEEGHAKLKLHIKRKNSTSSRNSSRHSTPSSLNNNGDNTTNGNKTPSPFTGDKTKLSKQDILRLHKEEIKKQVKELEKMERPKIYPNHSEISFYGASGTVTGSKHYVTCGSLNVLIDCGMFQGLKELRERNWKLISSSKPVELMTDSIIITHSHIDHTGYLPRMYALGFRGTIWMTEQTFNLCKLVLLDSAHIQEEDAYFSNKENTTKHPVALPLYSEDEVRGVLDLVKTVKYGEKVTIKSLNEEDFFTFKFFNAGHLLGSSFVEVSLSTGEKLIFSGDLGTFKHTSPVHQHPQLPIGADIMVVEATYGGKSHIDFQTGKATENENYLFETKVKPDLKKAVDYINERGGCMLIPAFAIGRSQQIAYYLLKMMRDGDIPVLPVHINSPMAVEALNFYLQNLVYEHQEDAVELLKLVKCHNTTAESKELNNQLKQGYNRCIIISSSGMLVGGRCLFHLETLAPENKNVILISGFQAEGTRGRCLQEGCKELKLHGKTVPINAKVMTVTGLSAHGDTEDVIKWIEAAKNPKPKMIFVVHGEPNSLRQMAREIVTELEIDALVPKRGTTFHMKNKNSHKTSRRQSMWEMEQENLRKQSIVGKLEKMSKKDSKNLVFAVLLLVAVLALIMKLFL